MKKFLGTVVCTCIALFLFSQSKKVTIKGIVQDSLTNEPVSAATVFVNNQTVIANENGSFLLGNLSKGMQRITVSCVGYQSYTINILIERNEPVLKVLLSRKEMNLQTLEVKSLRATLNAPFSKTTLRKEDISAINLGQDLPILLNQTPSVVVNSDAGNGIGYTGIHIRGTDATRINVSLNGIPYNDAESQGAYFVDLPDMASSTNSIQIQRGVGTSSNGTGAFGASINLSTNEYNEKAYAELNNTYGSFNTWKNTLKLGTGLLHNHFTLDARVSNISSDGYIDRASTKLNSFAVSGAYIAKKTSLRFNIFSGKEKTYQAWDGVPQDSLTTNRKYNEQGMEKPGSPYNNQTDNYQQDHYQLFLNHTFNKRWSMNIAGFLTYGRGYYEQYKGVVAETNAGDNSNTSFAYYGLPNLIVGTDTTTNTDLIRQLWLKNYFYGQIASVNHKTEKNEITLGGAWTRYEGGHFGRITWAELTPIKDFQYYNNPVLKTDENVYLKWQHKFNENWQSFIDCQYRHVYHRINGFEGASVGSSLTNLYVARSFDFMNPKIGMTYTKNDWQAFISYALAQKEPNYSDFKSTISSSTPKPEKLHDIEVGISKTNGTYNFGATFYYMYYQNQLVATGMLNDVGESKRVNVPNSYRVGLELQGGYVFTNWLNTSLNFTLSRNKIASFDEYLYSYDDYMQHFVATHKKTDISFSPSIVGGATVNLLPTKHCTVSLISKYVGNQYLDNTESNERMIDRYYTQDGRISYSFKHLVFKEWSIIGQVNNVFNNKYLSSGAAYPYIYGGNTTNSNYYFPMAGTNFLMAVNIKF